MRSIIAIAAFVSAANTTAASGGLSCDVEDKSVRVSIASGVTHGMGSPIFNFAGKLEVLDKTVAEDLQKAEFSDAHVAQYWLDEQNLRLLLYREREGDKPHGYVELLIQTQAGDNEGLYGGSYKMTVFDTTGDTSAEGKTVTADGEVSCFVE
jgi:hypothetical protein